MQARLHKGQVVNISGTQEYISSSEMLPVYTGK